MKTSSLVLTARSIFYATVMTCVGVVSSYSQVSLAPSALFIHARSGIGNLYVTNPSATPQEVNVEFVFGYPSADSTGNLTVDYRDTVAAQTYALNPYVKAYPRSFILQPKGQQTVRLQVRTKSSLKDAFLFTRVKVTSVEKSPEIGKKPTEGISAQVKFKFEQILPVFYTKGNLTTGLDVGDVATSVKDSKLTLVVDLERTGSAPFIGSAKAVLYSPAGTEEGRSEQTVSVYFNLKQKMEIDISKASRGAHKVVLTYETKRSDIAPEDLIQTQPITKDIPVNIE